MPGSRWKSFKLAAMAHNRSSPSPRPTESKAGNSRSSRSQLKEANGPPAIRWPLYPAFRTASASPQNSRARLVNTIDRPVISGSNAAICDTADAVSCSELKGTISAWCPLRSGRKFPQQPLAVEGGERPAGDQMALVPGIPDRLGESAELAGAVGKYHR